MERSNHGRTILLALICGLAGLAALPVLASANVTLPGLNGKLAFASDRDAPAPPPDVIRGQQDGNCEGAPQGDGECGFDIFTMNPDGSALVNLTKDQAGENNSKDDKPSWSPDGTQIAFESRRDCRTDNQAHAETCEADIFVMNADGSNVRQLTDDEQSDTHPTWSPDGNTIAFERGSPDRIFTVPAAGGALTEVDTGLTGDDSNTLDLLPAWSPDGTEIAFTRVQQSGQVVGAGLPELESLARSGDVSGLSSRGLSGFSIHTYRVTLSSGTVTEVGPVEECFFDGGTCQFDLNPAYPPNGQRIAFHRLTISGLGIPEIPGPKGFDVSADDVDIINSSLDGSDQTTLADEGHPCTSLLPSLITARSTVVTCLDDFKPAYSPNSSRIAFHSDRDTEGKCLFDTQGPNSGPFAGLFGGCRPQLYLMNSDGSGVTGPIAPATIRGEVEGDQATDRNADWQRIIPPPPPTITTPTPAATRDTRRPRVSVAAVRGCSASRRLRVPVRIAERGGIRSVTVTLDGRRIARTRKTRFTLTINARRLRPGRHRLKIVAVDASGNRTTVNRTIARCAQRVAPRPPSFTG